MHPHVPFIYEQLERMQRMIGDTSENLGAATSELSELRGNVSTLRQQLDAANSELRSANSQLVSVEVSTCSTNEIRNVVEKWCSKAPVAQCSTGYIHKMCHAYKYMQLHLHCSVGESQETRAVEYTTG